MTHECWQGRIDLEEGEGGLRLHQIMREYGDEALALVGFACDAGVVRNQGRAGAREAPFALRQALASLPVLPGMNVGDAGDIACVGDALEAAQAAYAEKVAALMTRGVLPIGLGGGHEIAYAAGTGLRMALPQARIGIINIDAHLDVRIDRRPSSGTPFRQLAEDAQAQGHDFHSACLGASRFANTPSLFTRAAAMGAWVLEDSILMQQDFSQTAAQIKAFCADKDALYVTLDLDCLPASVMPAVSAPAAFGLPVFLVEKLLGEIFASGKVRLCDVAEYNPRFDIDSHGARTAARLIVGMMVAAVENGKFSH